MEGEARPLLVQDERGYRAELRDFARDATEKPAFQSRLAMTAYDDQVSLLRADNGDKGGRDQPGGDPHLDLDSCQTGVMGEQRIDEVAGSFGTLCRIDLPFPGKRGRGGIFPRLKRRQHDPYKHN